MVAHADSAAVQLLADRTGAGRALSAAVSRRGFTTGRDRGQVLVDVAMVTSRSPSPSSSNRRRVPPRSSVRPLFGHLPAETLKAAHCRQISAAEGRRARRHLPGGEHEKVHLVKALSATLQSEADPTLEIEATGSCFLVCRVLGLDAGQGVYPAVA